MQHIEVGTCGEANLLTSWQDVKVEKTDIPQFPLEHSTNAQKTSHEDPPLRAFPQCQAEEQAFNRWPLRDGPDPNCGMHTSVPCRWLSSYMNNYCPGADRLFYSPTWLSQASLGQCPTLRGNHYSNCRLAVPILTQAWCCRPVIPVIEGSQTCEGGSQVWGQPVQHSEILPQKMLCLSFWTVQYIIFLLDFFFFA
jgi:hypothetical protein